MAMISLPITATSPCYKFRTHFLGGGGMGRGRYHWRLWTSCVQAFCLTTCCLWNIPFVRRLSYCGQRDTVRYASEMSRIETVNRRPLVANSSFDVPRVQHESECRRTIYLLSGRVMPLFGIVDSRSTVASAWQEPMNQLDNCTSAMFEVFSIPVRWATRQSPAFAPLRVVQTQAKILYTF